MSKRELKIYLKEQTKKQLTEQVLELYTKFKPVQTYYNFVFKPNEQKLLDEAKFKIGKEYFPLNNRKPKARRSVAQKIIKHYILLGVEPLIVLDVMLYNIEVAQEYALDKSIKQEAFYKSMLKSFEELLGYARENRLMAESTHRITAIVKNVNEQNWMNSAGFEHLIG